MYANGETQTLSLGDTHTLSFSHICFLSLLTNQMNRETKFNFWFGVNFGYEKREREREHVLQEKKSGFLIVRAEIYCVQVAILDDGGRGWGQHKGAKDLNPL